MKMQAIVNGAHNRGKKPLCRSSNAIFKQGCGCVKIYPSLESNKAFSILQAIKDVKFEYLRHLVLSDNNIMSIEGLNRLYCPSL